MITRAQERQQERQQQPPQRDTMCQICGRLFVGQHGLKIHKALAHDRVRINNFRLADWEL